MKHSITRFLIIIFCGTCLTLTTFGERSYKRGVSANVLSATATDSLAPGVSWTYNWGTAPGNLDLQGKIEFLPMLWGNNLSGLNSLKTYLDEGATPSTILVLNEPNLSGQAFITPEASANWLAQVKSELSSYNLPIIGPQMSLGSAPESSIVAYDPIQEKTVTYTTMEMFLDAYDYYTGESAPTEGLAVHPYGNAGELKWAVNTIYERYGKPVWVTEFAYWDAPTNEDEYAYMIEVLDFLEHSPKVARYAWFKADLGSRSKLGLLNTDGSLNRLGQLYVNYPTYNPEYFYPVPGRIEAESYHNTENLSIRVAEDENGMGALYASRLLGWADYQINVATKGRYRMRMRISGDNLPEIEVLANGTLTDPAAGKNRDIYSEINLEAGEQTLRILMKSQGTKLDWFELNLLRPTE